MKLELFGFDFEESTITFAVPPEIMNSRRWGAGKAEVDLSEISDGENEPSVQADAEPCGFCSYWKIEGETFCQRCGRDLRTA